MNRALFQSQDGGAGLLIVSRGVTMGASGRFVTSGDDGIVGVRNGADERPAWSGGGAGGAPGAVVMVLDGSSSPSPALTSGSVIADYGATPKPGGTFNVLPNAWISEPKTRIAPLAVDGALVPDERFTLDNSATSGRQAGIAAARFFFLIPNTTPEEDTENVKLANGQVISIVLTEAFESIEDPAITIIKAAITKVTTTASYSHANIYTRILGDAIWVFQCPAEPNCGFQLPADGNTYEVQARPVLTNGVESTTGILNTALVTDSNQVPANANSLTATAISEGVSLTALVPNGALGTPTECEFHRVTAPHTLYADASRVLVETVPVSFDQANDRFIAIYVDASVTGGTTYSYFVTPRNKHGASANHFPTGGSAGIAVTPIATAEAAPGGATAGSDLFEEDGTTVVNDVDFLNDLIDRSSLPNGGFEEGTLFWTLPTSWAVSSTLVRTGSLSAECSETRGVTRVLQSAAINAAEGQRIYTSSWIRATVGYNGTFTVRLSWRDASDVEFAQTLWGVPVGGLTAGWLNRTISAVAPSGAHYVRALFQSSGQTAGECYVDDAEAFPVADDVALVAPTLIQNPGFEQGLAVASVWDITTEATIENDSANAYEGDWYAQFIPTANRDYYQFEAPVPVTARAWLAYGFWVRNGTTGFCSASIKFYNAAGSVVSVYDDLLNTVAAGGTSYQQAWMRAQVPFTAVAARFGLNFKSSPTGTWRVDGRQAIYTPEPPTVVKDSVLFNGDISLQDAKAKPVGIRSVEGITTEAQIKIAGAGARITNTPTSPVGYGFQAVRIIDTNRYLVTVRHKSVSAATSGLTIRVHESTSFDPIFLDTFSHVGHNDGSGLPAHAIEETGHVDLENNAAMPGTTVIEETFIYIPTGGTNSATLAFHNLTSPAVGYELEEAKLDVQPRGPGLIWFEVNATDWTFLARNFDGLVADTSAGAGTVLLPANPQVGWQIGFQDASATWDTNNLTVQRNGSNIQSLAQDMALDIVGAGGNGLFITLTYFNATRGWILG